MSAATFVAVHCGATFTGAEGAAGLTVHMREVHGVKPLKPGAHEPWEHPTPGWRNGEIAPPTPWTPPRRNLTPEKVAAKWGYDVWYVDISTIEHEEAA